MKSLALIISLYLKPGTLFKIDLIALTQFIAKVNCKLFEYELNFSVLEYIDVQKHMKPSIYGSEIQQRLLLDGLVHPTDLPSVSQINWRLGQDLVMTYKKTDCFSSGSGKPEAVVAKMNIYKRSHRFQPADYTFLTKLAW